MTAASCIARNVIVVVGGALFFKYTYTYRYYDLVDKQKHLSLYLSLGVVVFVNFAAACLLYKFIYCLQIKKCLRSIDISMGIVCVQCRQLIIV